MRACHGTIIVAAPYLGFHGYALTALESAPAGVPAEALAGPGIRLRAAIGVCDPTGFARATPGTWCFGGSRPS